MSYGELLATTNLAGYYKMEGDLTDFSGNGRTLTNSSGTFVTPGKLGSQAYNTSGSQYAYRNDNYGITGGAITIAMWFKYTSSSGDDSDLAFQSGTGSPYIGYELWYRLSTKLVIFSRVRYGAGSPNSNFMYDISTSPSWVHIVGTFDGTNIVVYVNGVQGPISNATGNGVSPGFNSKLTLSCYYDARFFIRGQYDEVIVEPRAWSYSEVRNHYNLTKGNLCPKLT